MVTVSGNMLQQFRCIMMMILILTNFSLGFEFNIGYPGCTAPEPETVGDNECNKENDVQSCKFDGGDCCPIKTDTTLTAYSDLLGDGNCHAGFFFTEKCIYDNGDCKFDIIF